MPIPILLGIAAIAGVGSGIGGAVKMKDASDTMKSAQRRHDESQRRFKEMSEKSTVAMDELGKKELEVMNSFEVFANLIEKIKNRPQFKEINKNGVKLPTFSPEELKKVSIGAGVILGGLGGAAAGTAGGVAAAGATAAAVLMFGTASTGTAIASLSGAAATNAALAALGGGSIAAGGGGMAAGAALLGGATLGVGLLVGGVIFNITGSKMSDKADEAWRQSKKEEEQVNTICTYFEELIRNANLYQDSLNSVKRLYDQQISILKHIVDFENKTDWYYYNEKEKRVVENTSILVALLYKMCKVQLVLKSEDENQMNKVNTCEIQTTIDDAKTIIRQVA